MHDGAGVVLKQETRKEQMNMDDKIFQNASDVVSFYESKQMEEHVAYPNAKRQVFWFFHLVKPKDVDRSVMWDCKNIVGT